MMFSDRSGSKLRPVVFLYAIGEDFVFLKMTSQWGFQDEFIKEIYPDEQNKLRSISYVQIKYIVTAHFSIFKNPIWSLFEEQKQEIRDKLSAFFAKL